MQDRRGVGRRRSGIALFFRRLQLVLQRDLHILGSGKLRMEVANHLLVVIRELALAFHHPVNRGQRTQAVHRWVSDLELQAPQNIRYSLSFHASHLHLQ